MPFRVTDKQTGRVITFENQPTDDDLNEAFGMVEESKSPPPPVSKPSIGRQALDVATGIVETPLAIATGIPAMGMGLLGGIAKTLTSGDVEGKKTREDITRAFTYQPTSETGKGAMNILSTAMTPLGIPRKIGEYVGGEQWGNLADVAMLGLLPKVPAALKKVADIPYKTGEFLYRKTLQPAGTAAETKAITTTGYEGGYGSTMGDRAKFYKDLRNVQREAGQIISKNEGKTIPMDKILKPLDERINKLQNVPTELPETHLRALERVKLQITRQWLKAYPDGNIPVRKVQEFKIQLYDRAKNAYGETQVSMTPEARKILARGAREELETIMPEIGVVNRRMKPLLEFEDALDKSIVRIKNEKFSITNTIFNNDFLLGKLAKVFKALSPKHPLATPQAVKAYLYARGNVNFKEAFEKPPVNLKQNKQIGTVAKTVLEPPDSVISGFAHGKENVVKTINGVTQHKGMNIDATILKNEQGKYRVILHSEGDKSFIDAGALLRQEGDKFIIENIANQDTILNAIPLLKKVINNNLGKIIIDKNAPKLAKEVQPAPLPERKGIGIK